MNNIYFYPLFIILDNQSIYQSWSEFILDFIVLILRDIFILSIEKTDVDGSKKETETASTSAAQNRSNENMERTLDIDIVQEAKIFVACGARDVFLGRKQSKKITVHTLKSEMLDSQDRFKKNVGETPLKAIVKVLPNRNSYDEITIEFYDLIKTKKNNSFRTFFNSFDQNLNYLLKIYFVHKCAAFNDKKTVTKA